MMLSQKIGNIIGEACGYIRVAFGHVRDEINEVVEGYNAVVRKRCRRLLEYIAKGCVLGVLALEICSI